MSILDYELWKNQNESYLRKLTQKQVILTYSGGKDSSVVLHYIQKAAKEFDFTFEVHGVVFPKHVLNATEREKLDSFWYDKDITINWHTVRENDDQLREQLRQGISPCLMCYHVKKNVIKQYFSEIDPQWQSVVIILSYSLWDLVSATIEHILGVIYADAGLSKTAQGKNPTDRFLETSQRFYPWLQLNSGLTIYKPLIQHNDQDIQNVIARNQIPLTTPVCDFKDYRPKRILAKYYHGMDLHFAYERVFDFAKSALNLPDIEFFSAFSSVDYLKKMI